MLRNARLLKEKNLAVSILQGTNAFQMLNLLYNFNINKGVTALTKISGMNKSELLKYLDQLQAIDLDPLATATKMDQFIRAEIRRMNLLASGAFKEVPAGAIGEDSLGAITAPGFDWEKWLGYYWLPSEYVYSAQWASGAERIVSIKPFLREQEPVNPRQQETEYASRNVWTEADWEKVVKNATIIRHKFA